MKRLVLKIFVFVMFVILLLQFNQGESKIMETDCEKLVSDKQINKDLNPHSSISINSDSGFETYGFPGNGSENNPYRIENLLIETNDFYGIYISSTTKHFIIKECTIDAYYQTIDINYIADNTATIINNTLKNMEGDGISIISANGANITKNKITADYSTIYTNYGISLSISSNLTIKSNEVYGFEIGILLSQNNHYVANNTVKDSKWIGIHVDGCLDSTIINNTLFNDGFFIRAENVTGYFSSTFANNTINGKPFAFFYNTDDLTINEQFYGQIIFLECNRVVIKDQILNYAGGAIRFIDCNDLEIYNNTFNFNDYFGVRTENCSSVRINNNTFNNDMYGIQIYDGINSNTTNNSFYKNNDYLLADSYGLYCENCTSSNFTKNYIVNHRVGFHLHWSQNNKIVNNSFIGNIIYGLRLFESSANVIFSNVFNSNNLGGTSQAFDDGINNWYDELTSKGNYWSDYDGIGPYEIDGPSNAVDPFPEYIAPIINTYREIPTFVPIIFLTISSMFLYQKKNKKSRTKKLF